MTASTPKVRRPWVQPQKSPATASVRTEAQASRKNAAARASSRLRSCWSRWVRRPGSRRRNKPKTMTRTIHPSRKKLTGIHQPPSPSPVGSASPHTLPPKIRPVASVKAPTTHAAGPVAPSGAPPPGPRAVRHGHGLPEHLHHAVPHHQVEHHVDAHDAGVSVAPEHVTDPGHGQQHGQADDAGSGIVAAD